MTPAARTAPATIPPPPADPRLAGLLPGRFIVLDGPDGSGKSTQLRRLVALAQHAGLDPCEVREPGGTDLGEEIRRLLLSHAREDIAVRAEMLLYMASRAQLVERRILPALAERRPVLADRFVSSTLAYQGAAGGLPEEDIRAVARVVTQQAAPDAVVIFDVDVHTAMARMNPLLRGGSLDRMESKGAAFHQRVREGYLRQAEQDPAYLVIDASRPEDEVWQDFTRRLADHLERLPPRS